MDVLFTGEGLISLVSLTMLEIVLGIDNIIFIAILSQKVAAHQQQRVRRVGLSRALRGSGVAGAWVSGGEAEARALTPQRLRLALPS